MIGFMEAGVGRALSAGAGAEAGGRVGNAVFLHQTLIQLYLPLCRGEGSLRWTGLAQGSVE